MHDRPQTHVQPHVLGAVGNPPGPVLNKQVEVATEAGTPDRSSPQVAAAVVNPLTSAFTVNKSREPTDHVPSRAADAL